MDTETDKGKSFKLKLIEGLGLKNMLISKLVYRPPKPSYTFQEYSDMFNNKKLSFCLIKKNKNITVKNPNLDIHPYIIQSKTSYCPTILLTSTKARFTDSISFAGVSPLQQNTLSVSVETKIESKMINSKNSFNHANLENSRLLTTNDYQKRESSFQSIMRNTLKSQRILVIFSHGNASDLGDVYFFGEGLVINYDVDFLSYDYTGYGLGKGKHEINETQIYEDLQNVLAFATNQLSYKLNQIILWGFSLGSGPTVELASRYSTLGGVVLQAPLASLLLWLDGERNTIKAGDQDVYSNINKISSVKSKILIIHGKKDEVINIRHSRLLIDKIKESQYSFKIKKIKNNKIMLCFCKQAVLIIIIFKILFCIMSQMLDKILYSFQYLQRIKQKMQIIILLVKQDRLKSQQDQTNIDQILLNLACEGLIVKTDSQVVGKTNDNNMMIKSTKGMVKPLDDHDLSYGNYQDTFFTNQQRQQNHQRSVSRRVKKAKWNFLFLCGCCEQDQ